MIFHSTSKKPVLIVGNGVRNSEAVEVLLKLYNKTKIPVLTSMNAVDMMQDDKRLGFIGVYGNRVANMIIASCDLVIAVGVRLGLRQIGNKKEYFAPNAKLIRVDIDEAELSRDVKPDEEKYLMDAKIFLSNLLNEEIPQYIEWNRNCFEAKNVLQSLDNQVGNWCMEKISTLLPNDPIVTLDIGQNQCWAAQSLTIKGTKGRIIVGGSYGSMGCGLPYAIGASIAQGKDVVFCIVGDGGLQMNIQELQTVVGEKLPIKIFVINNRTLGKISEIQEIGYQGRFSITTRESGYTVPDFVKIANAYGIKAMTFDSYEELEKCKEWLTDDEPCLMNILLPDNTKLLPKVNWNEKEMLPLLPDEIMNKVKKILG